MTLEEKLKEWHRCNTKRLEHSREAKSLQSRCEQLELDFEAELIRSNRTSIVRYGFTLCWAKGRASVAWADEYLKAFGPEKVTKLKLQAAAEASKVLCIEAPQSVG
ncbi:hypothetical protein VN12_20745 [Pirellula sp. SH-Sr6A]|uniref:hypothetical protein n=1 Tax=Pirellula sp. SH-Sr6A TaxID=1632865 RepID=UPI00078BE4B1|nr:hypothetical protein [Pirellula sp. SH-Sr6A]AMV34565.1 hypothetical protein VN12_20745 [Pirellula sp. SH-Sr6A]